MTATTDETALPTARPTTDGLDARWRVIWDDGDRDPVRNLALDEALARCAGPRPTVRLWRNAPCVVLGRFQVAAAEVDAEACEALGVPVYRRFTGGGAVYHDPGNLNVSLVWSRDGHGALEHPANRAIPALYGALLGPIAAAVRGLGFGATASDRDVTIRGRKVSGVAAWLGRDARLVHATLLVDADLVLLGRVLDGPGDPGNPRWERTKSRRVRVTCLARELATLEGRNVTTVLAGVDAAVVRALAGDDAQTGAPTDDERALAGQLVQERYGRTAWHGQGVP